MGGMSENVAILSDIHGNRWALEAVMEDATKRGIYDFINLGDSCYGPLDPAGTATILINEDVPSISGNEDRSILENLDRPNRQPTMEYVIGELSPQAIAWLNTLPRKRLFHDVMYLCHGMPDKDDEYLVEKVTPAGGAASTGSVTLKTEAEIQAAVKDIPQPLVLCGHSHIFRQVRLANGQLIINPGSVGLQAFRADEPVKHSLAAGTPHARYAILSDTGVAWRVESVALMYDWQTAADVARRNQRLDWAEWLTNGRA